MNKSQILNNVAYNFLDVDNDKFTIKADAGLLQIYDKDIDCILAINQTTANELIKILKEFVDTGDLR